MYAAVRLIVHAEEEHSGCRTPKRDIRNVFFIKQALFDSAALGRKLL